MFGCFVKKEGEGSDWLRKRLVEAGIIPHQDFEEFLAAEDAKIRDWIDKNKNELYPKES